MFDARKQEVTELDGIVGRGISRGVQNKQI